MLDEPEGRARDARRGSRSASTDDRLGLDKDDGEKRLDELVERIDELQYRLYAEDRRSVLLVLQGLDASGKDGVVRRVFEGVNPTGVERHVVQGAGRRGARSTTTSGGSTARCRGAARSASSTARTTRTSSPCGCTRSRRRRSGGRRYAHIREFERMLVDEGTTVLKVFLNVSRDEQRARFQERIDDPGKRWKFRRDDLKVRERFDDWVAAWEEARHRDLDRLGAVVRRAGRPELGEGARRRGARRRRARAARPAASRARGGDRGDADPSRGAATSESPPWIPTPRLGREV